MEANLKLYCKTAELRKMLPVEFSTHDLERMTGIEERMWCRVRNVEYFKTSEETADRLLTALGTPHLYHQLDFHPWSYFKSPHGLTGYKKMGCRCSICVAANKQAAWRHRRKKGVKMRGNGTYKTLVDNPTPSSR